jgi:ubiquitin carboxyl-terminal hydrolase 5/13
MNHGKHTRIGKPMTLSSIANVPTTFIRLLPLTTDSGILVNLGTFIGTSRELAMNKSDYERGIFVRIVKKHVPKEWSSDIDETQPTKLGVSVDGGFASPEDDFEIVSKYSIVILDKEQKVVCDLDYDTATKPMFPDQIVKSADSIIRHSGLSVQQDFKVWELDEETKPVPKYCENLPFVDNGVKINPDPSTWKCCEVSGNTENLWLNLLDGFIGGGCKNWDGSGGSNGALDQFLATGERYLLVVKLGTITANESLADCYSYAKDEDGPVLIPNLAELLEKRGIYVSKI